MSRYIVRTTGKLNDRQILNLFDALQTLDVFNGCSPSFSIGAIQVASQAVPNLLRDQTSYTINHAVVRSNTNTICLHYARNVNNINKSDNFSTNEALYSPFYDEIITDTSANGGHPHTNATDIILIDEIVSKYIIFQIPRSLESSATDTIGLLQKNLTQISDLHHALMQDTLNTKSKLLAEFIDKKSELEKELEKQKTDQENASEAERLRISKLKEEIEESKRNIDDRDHMHVRRELRKSITDEIENRMNHAFAPLRVTLGGMAIVAISLLSAFGAGYFAYSNFISLNTILNYDPNQIATAFPNAEKLTLIFAIRGSISAIVSLGFVAYTLSWLKKTYTDSIKTSNDLRKYGLDINRASWIIETIMEMTTKEGRALPDKWVEGVCFGLFHSGGETKADTTPLDALGSLLGVSARAEFGPNGPKFEIEKGQLKKLAKPKETNSEA